jgi:hypothetical protein
MRTAVKFLMVSLMLAGSFIQSTMAQSAPSSLPKRPRAPSASTPTSISVPLISVDITRKQSTSIEAGNLTAE